MRAGIERDEKLLIDLEWAYVKMTLVQMYIVYGMKFIQSILPHPLFRLFMHGLFCHI